VLTSALDPCGVQVVYMQNAVKVFSAACRSLGDDADLEAILHLVKDRLTIFMQSVHVEVQERSTTFRNLLSSLGVLVAEKPPRPAEEPPANPDSGGVLNLLMAEVQEAAGGVSAARLNVHLFEAMSAEQLNPVNPKAQRKVPVPEGLDLAVAFNAVGMDELVAFTEGFPRNPDLARVSFTNVYLAPEAEEESVDAIFSGSRGYEDAGSRPGSAERTRRGQEYSGYQVDDAAGERARWQETPFYLSSRQAPVNPQDVDVDNIPVIRLTSADLDGRSHKKDKRRKGKGKHRHNRSSSSGSGSLPSAPVMKDEVMPDGAMDSGDDNDK
jgi:AP-3 complex subunit delta